MISLLCQKSHSGVISTNQEGYSQTYISSLFKEDNEESVKSEENGGDYEFLRRFPSSTKSTTIRQLGASARSKTIKSAPTSVISSSTYYVMTTPAASHKAAKKAVQHLDKSNGEKETPSTQRTVTFDPRQQAVQDYYTQHPFRRLSSKKLRSVQKWIEQRLSEDPANLEFYNKLNDLLKREKELIKEINESLERCDAIELTRKELLYKDWYIHVYEPIQMEIFKSMNGDGSRAAYKMERDTKYTTYLSKVNERGCMYQDDFAPEDYDPTSAVKLDANVARRLKDPTNIPQRKALIEENVILSAEQGRLFTLKQLERTKLPVIVNDKQTRDDLTWNDWLLNQFKDVNSTARVRSAKKCMPNKMSPEHIDFNLIVNKKFGTPANSYRAAKEKA